MKKNIHKPLWFGIGATTFALAFAMAALPVAHAQTSPYITTSTSTNGVTVTMDLPNDYSGRVYTACFNSTCHSYATSTPLTSADIASIQNQIQQQEAQMQQLFAQEQQMFQEQQKMFQSMFGSQW